MNRCAAWTVMSLLLLCIPGVAMSADKRSMTIDDLFRFKRISDPQISPDGKWVVYVVGTVDMDRNMIVQNLWLAATDGKTPPRQLTTTDRQDRHPRWSPDGKRILFESTRSGESQLYIIELDGGEARQITTIATGASNAIWSPDGKHIAFVSAVYPEFSEKPYKESNELNKKKMEEIKNSPVKARIFTRLFYRHWDSYVEDKRQHLFVMPAPPETRSGGEGNYEPRDVTPGDRDAYPTSSTFETGDNFTFSPDGKYLIFTAVPKENEAWSTNYDLCRVSIDNRSTDWECLTKDNPAADSGPMFSPDGKMLAYRAQKKPGYEADKWELMVVPVSPSGAFDGKPVSLTASLDRSVDGYVWLGNGKALLLEVEQDAKTALYRVEAATRSAPMEWATGFGTVQSLSANREGSLVACSHATMRRPPEVAVLRPADPQKSLTLLSHVNDGLLQELDLPAPESVRVPTADGKTMQMWILKPPGFDPNKKWPLAYLVHGGPQSAWLDGWSWRWCPEVWAAQGYVVALPNPRGSTGFGQQFVDEISGDWGGKCFEDLMKGVEYLERLPYIDKDRMAAAGASFGGYMMNWFQGNTTKFKTLITHCSVYNNESMYATTDELWFDEWDHGGKPPWENFEAYRKHSPHTKAKNFKTPMLIIHNDLDFRCPVSEGHQLFTTLQRLGVPSKFINFPDEGHWVLKPKNSEFWHKEIFAWLKKYCPPGGK
ncbi:MAG: S9 family peptidase [Gemmatales bacterium]|nr:S9 family peptidase [Gemmatales bacterium]MDW8385765.1 S9 family peptidase [Gemmatales bacterium]